MMIWGKLIGVFFGLLMTRSPLGIILGGLVGHFFDRAFVKAWAYQQHQHQYHHQRQTPTNHQNGELASAYATLGLSPEASNLEVKRAYRKLMSQNHPDKLAAKGLSVLEIREANEKTQKIRAAYESIIAARGRQG